MKKLEKAKEVYEAIKVPNELNYVVNKAILDKKKEGKISINICKICGNNSSMYIFNFYIYVKCKF